MKIVSSNIQILLLYSRKRVSIAKMLTILTRFLPQHIYLQNQDAYYRKIVIYIVVPATLDPRPVFTGYVHAGSILLLENILVNGVSIGCDRNECNHNLLFMCCPRENFLVDGTAGSLGC